MIYMIDEMKRKEFLEGMIYEIFTSESCKDMVEYADIYGVTVEEMEKFIDENEEWASNVVAKMQELATKAVEKR